MAHAGRGEGLATRMLFEIIGRQASSHVSYLDTTISPSNEASRALFRGFARRLGVPVEQRQLFGEHHFPQGGDHESEVLFRIGPFEPRTRA